MQLLDIIYIYISLFTLKESFSTRQSMILKDQNTARDIENRDLMHGVRIPCTLDASRMGTVMVKQEEDGYKNNAE